MSSSSTYDAIVLGGGHNGLVSAFYLARAGLKVALFEKRDRLGGPCANEEPFPGFKVSFTNSPGSLEPRIVNDMKLESFGLEFGRPDPSLIHLIDEEREFVAWRDRAQVREQMARLDPREPDAYKQMYDYIDWFAERLNTSIWQEPESIAALASRLVTAEEQKAFSRFFLESVSTLVDDFLYTDEMKAVVSTLSMMSTSGSPRYPGTAQMLLWRPLSRLSARSTASHDPRESELRGSTGLPRGGMAAVTQAMEASVRAVGVDIFAECGIAQIVVDADADVEVRGVVTEDGRSFMASKVISTLAPHVTLLDMAGGEHLPSSLVSELRSSIPEGTQFKVAVALDGLPTLKAQTRHPDADISRCQLRISGGLDYMDEAWSQARSGDWSSDPIVWGLIPSVDSPGLAPEGKHIASLNIYHAPFTLSEGRSWNGEKAKFAERCIDVVSAYYRDFEERVIDYHAWSPVDIADEFGMPGANVSYGDLVPSRSFGLRPLPELSSYRTPIHGLYLAGSAMYPGGYVTGVPGRNGAEAVIADQRRSDPSREGEKQTR